MTTPHAPKPLRDLALIKLSFSDSTKLQSLIVNLERDGIQHADIEDSLRVISRRFERFSLKGRVIDLYSNNRIFLLSNKETIQVPAIVPAWRMGGTNGVVAYVNLTQYTPYAGAREIDSRKLFGFMTIGAVLVDTYTQWNKITASVKLLTAGSKVYSRMMFRVIDRITGIGTERLRSDQLKYVLAKYFLIGMAGRVANDATDAIAMSATNGTGVTALINFENNIAAIAKVDSQTELYTLPITTFIDSIGKSAQWLNRLNFRNFLQNFASLYDPPSILMMEDLGYFFALAATHQSGSEIIKGFSFDTVYGKEGDEMIDELARLVR